jgi:hypothetical protein
VSPDLSKPRHSPACPQDQPPREAVGTQGDRMLRCATCPAFWFPRNQSGKPAETPVQVYSGGPSVPARVVTSLPPSSRYRCRTHPGVPVTWKGTGCEVCDATPTVSRSALRRLRNQNTEDAQPTWLGDDTKENHR